MKRGVDAAVPSNKLPHRQAYPLKTPPAHASLRGKILEDLSLVDTAHRQIQVTVTVAIAKNDFMRRSARPGRPGGLR